MAEFPNFRYILYLNLVILYFLTLIIEPISPFTVQTLKINNPNFDSDIVLFGDAEVANDNGVYVKLKRPFSSSYGLLIHTKPLRFIRTTSFNTVVTFSISTHDRNGLVLALFPSNFPGKLPVEERFGISPENSLLGVQFHTAFDGNVGDSHKKNMKTDVGVFVPIKGDKLTVWIDYDSSSKRLEIRLSKFGESRPYSPYKAYTIDLFDKCRGKEVFVGLSSLSNNSAQFTSVYSWRFRLKDVNDVIHSLPIDPRGYSDKKGGNMRVQKNDDCSSKVFAGLIFATGCGATVAFLALFLWAIVVSRNTVFASESHMKPVDFSYEKVSVVVDDTLGVNNKA